jgi:signal transduction histidine kinase/CheY-like chemotaxis protein
MLPIEIFNDGRYMYVKGIAPIFFMILGGLYLVIDIFCIIKNRSTIEHKKIIPLLVLVIGFSSLFVLRSINPGLVLMSVVFSIVTFIMYHTIENPDVKMIEQLELARDTADKANAAKTDFLSSMSHEIRTPLNAIVGFSDCIVHSNELSEAKDNARDIINASNTLLEIVNGILDISKIEAGKMEIVNSNYDANNLFNGLAKLMTPKMTEKGLDFQVTVSPDLPKVLYGDSANVKKVVTNLLSNAYKYTDHGFVKYDVKCVNTNGICRLIITVSDSGRGIKKESLDKLFTKFQRVDEDKNTTIEGTGLGLAITKQLVELMGGTIVVNSTYGEGSKFTITLDQRIENETAIIEEKEVYDTIDLTGKKILVVDDNSINLKVARKLLERYHAEVETCDSGFGCIELIEAGNVYDLILMDDMMPKMSGTQTLNKLREIVAFNMPVFALTANAITGMKERYLEAGFDSYLAKPIEKEAMINEFNKLFNKVTINAVVSEEKVKYEQNEKVNYLLENSIDVNHGLELLGNLEAYDKRMSEFVEETNRKMSLLSLYKENEDMLNYAILIHGIKSDCKYLGIIELNDMAYEHELKSKANEIEFVNKSYDDLINLINKYLAVCKNYLGRE